MSSADLGKPGVFVQLLFGRYRDWGNVRWSHLIILGSIMTVMAYLYLLFLRSRLRKYAVDRERLRNRKHMPLTQRDLGRTMYHLLINSMVKVKHIRDAKVRPEDNGLEYGDPGYGKEGHMRDVHFHTSIAKSFFVLEKAALSRRPGLRHRDSRSVRDYMAALRKAFPSIPPALCEEYTETYERAVFSSHRFNAREYERFMRVTLNIVAVIKS